MTTYTTINNTDIDVDSPVTTSLMNKLRDNPIAITEGASGAPKIQAAALDTDSVTANAIAAGAVGSSELGSNAVNTANINNGAITQAKLASDVQTVKAWVKWNSSETIVDDFGVSSVAIVTGTELRVTFDSAFSNANYVGSGIPSQQAGGQGNMLSIGTNNSQTTTQYYVTVHQDDGTENTGNTEVHMMFAGDN
ncbi:MAG: hypothetical protein PQ612_06065 [Rickettsiales bacterium]|nr:hypothetical protein [Pseudomonadota bacterium]MDA0966889.1 hypothetical protein [Pseudomonadota bacterium]MDG4543564.1 hypothetical protein [Rickettsiales bacterium]MDG4545712.1 hypothetical protein [Rickettsiales bacterium]MDG4547515.1 hypothetical protein [Rickettsiales bacterium]